MRFLILCFFVLFFALDLVAQPLHPCAQLIWQDEFDGPGLDATKWTPQTGDGCPSLCGWGNNELQYYTDREENIKVDGGNLVITSLKESFGGREYTSGKVRSINKGDFNFGRIEARIKVPQGAGSWPAFWMLPTDEVFGSWPQSGEIDIMEHQGKTPTMVNGTVHYGNPIPGNKYKSGLSYLSGGANYYEDFHTFVIDWDSTAIKWYRDGILYFTFDKTQASPHNWPFNERFHLILNNAVGGNLGGTVNDASMPQTLLVDYVRVYSSPDNFSIIGDAFLFANASNTHYYVPAVAGATDYQWEVPTGATITDGQGTSSITVDWGGASSSGDVTVGVVKPCATLTKTLTVRVLEADACDLIFDDFDVNRNTVYGGYTSSTFSTSATNPDKTGINSSNLCGSLDREAGNNATFTLSSVPVLDFSDFETGARVLYLDTYTNAAVGTTVEIRLINKNKAQGAYPAGVRTILRAKTTVRFKWETLVFKLDHIEDASTLISEVDGIVVVFHPENTFTVGRVLMFDNIRRGALPYNAIVGNASPTACNVSALPYSVTNNPSSAYEWSSPAGTAITGQNTSAITVNWSSVTTGRIYLKETISGCTQYTGTLDVKIVACPTGILEASATQGLTLYPNPSRDHITIEGELRQPAEVKLVVSTSLGETVMTETYYEQAGSFSKALSLQNLKAGTYMVQFITEQEVRAAKLIKY